MEMKREEVLGNLAQICSSFKGTWEQHQYLQAALKWLDAQLPKETSDNATT